MDNQIYNPDFYIKPMYKVLNYIRGATRLDLPILSNSDWIIQLKFMYEVYGGGVFFGYLDSSGDESGINYRFFSASGKWYFDLYSASSYRLYGGTVSTSTIYNFELGNRYVKDLDSGSYILGSSSTSKATNFSSTKTMWLFQDSDYGRCYSIKAYMNEVLRYNFIPTKRISDNSLGLYDKVTKKFYTTSNLVAGNETGEIIYG